MCKCTSLIHILVEKFTTDAQVKGLTKFINPVLFIKE